MNHVLPDVVDLNDVDSAIISSYYIMSQYSTTCYKTELPLLSKWYSIIAIKYQLLPL